MFCFKYDRASFRLEGNLGISLSVPHSLLLPLLDSVSRFCFGTGSSLTSSHLLFYLVIATKSSGLWHLLAGTMKTQWDTQCPGLINQPSSLHQWHWHLCDWHEQMWNLDLETQPAGMENWVMPSNHLRWIFPFSEPRVNGPLTSWRQKLKQKQLSGIPSLALAGNQ